MEKLIPKKEQIRPSFETYESDFFDRVWKYGWTDLKTVVDITREPALILNGEFRVMAANEPFYVMFRVEAKDTVNKILYELGDGQWSLPELRNLLEEVRTKNSFFKGFEVAREFPPIGRKVMLVNARQVYLKDNIIKKSLPITILFLMEDVTEMVGIADRLAAHTTKLEKDLVDQSQRFEERLEKLENDTKKKK